MNKETFIMMFSCLIAIIVVILIMLLTRHNEHVPVLVPVVGSVTSGAVSDGKPGCLVTDQLKFNIIRILYLYIIVTKEKFKPDNCHH